MNLDAVDLAILRVLDRDARLPVAQVAEAASVSRATAYNRIGRMQDAGIIRRYTIATDPQRVGCGSAALVLLTGGQLNRHELREQLTNIPAVRFAAFLAGGFDIAVLLRGRSLAEIRDVVMEQLHQLPGIRGTQTFFVLDEVADRINILPEP
ncbi:MAG TPA: Lrp/AsnC family transcriptional regulator [Trebonia sp.]|nr:Lrp/AsnC family transcriptional regulator [Trebonia sp.]